MSDRVLIREVGPREGFQIYPRVVPLKDRLRLIASLADTGVQEIEVVSLVRPDLVPQMADAEELIQKLPSNARTTFKALYLNAHGFKQAETFSRIQNEAWIMASVSETFLKRNNNRSHAELFRGLKEWRDLFADYKKPLHGIMLSTAFGCHYEGKFSAEKTLSFCDRLLQRLEDLGLRPGEIMLADTVGVATPDDIYAIVDGLHKRHEDIAPGLHLHDTKGRAVENARTGLACGVQIFESSIAGMGGCPFTAGAAGNIATEDLVLLCEDLGVQTGISYEKLLIAARIAKEVTPAVQ